MLKLYHHYQRSSKLDRRQGQAMMEFTFSMIIIFLMIYALVKITQWTGFDLVQRTQAHETQLFVPIANRYFQIGAGPLKQIAPYFHYPTPMNAVFGE